MLNPKRILSIVATVALAFACMAGFSGCGSSEPQNAKDVIEAFKATSPDNCNMKGSLDIAVGAAGMTMSIPVELDMDINGTSSHGIFSMSLFGAQTNVEVYGVEKDGKYLMYMKSNASGGMFGTSGSSVEGEWVVSEADSNALANVGAFGEGLFENATFEKTDNGYKLSVMGKDAYEYLQKIASETGNAATDSLSGIPEGATDLINSLVFDFLFDSNCNLTEISVPETTASVTTNGQTVDVTVSGDIAVSKHGQIGEIVVPDDVVNSAKPANASNPGDVVESVTDSSSGSASEDSAKAA
jgi:hypothetical protein